MALDIAVIGIGALLPDANSADILWDNVLSGRNSIGEVPPDRWLLEEHYDPDRTRPDKTYCKLGAFVRDYVFNPLEYRIPPQVAAAIDPVQRWSLKVARDALQDAGYLERDYDHGRTGVVLGNAGGGEYQFTTAYRVYLDQVQGRLTSAQAALGLDTATVQRLVAFLKEELPTISEDSMPGELSNIVSGRVANVLNLKGANYTVDAACGASLAALSSAARGLRTGQFDMVVSGGSDRSMGPPTYVKFSKIGALSPDGSYPFDRRANGFVMGEGAAAFLLKRLEDAVRDGDKIYAVIKGIGASSDGKGKGITAPNPVGQILALERGYEEAGIAPETMGLMEAHGTSTIVGDAVEGQVLQKFFSAADLKPRSVALGSVKSQIGHLKSAAGAAGMLKAVMAIERGVLPPSINFDTPNPDIDFDNGPFVVHTTPRPWERQRDLNRRAGVSSFGFGGANFHVVVEEHRPRSGAVAVPDLPGKGNNPPPTGPALFAAGADSAGELRNMLDQGTGREPSLDLVGKQFRVAFAWTTPEEKVKKAGLASQVLASGNEVAAVALRGQGIFLGKGESGKVAFLYPGQGSQYVGMLHGLAATYPQVKETFDEADRVMEPILGRPLTAFIWPPNFSDPAVRKEYEPQLMQTQITQPAILAVDVALTRLLKSMGLEPDMVMGHSLGEYAALVSAGIMDFEEALMAVSGRAKEMTVLNIEDPGKMASVFGPFEEVEKILKQVPGYAIPANVNSTGQTVVAGESKAIDTAMKIFEDKGFKAVLLPVSHAFHSAIVADASKPLRKLLERLSISPPKIPIVGNVDGKFYPTGPDYRVAILDRLEQQIAAPVQFVKGLKTLHDAGATTYVEVGPKRVLASFADDVLGQRGILSLFANHPKKGDLPSFNELLCGLFAAGVYPPTPVRERTPAVAVVPPETRPAPAVVTGIAAGLPGKGKGLFDEGRMDALIGGTNMIDSVGEETKQRMVAQRIVRLKKGSNGGDPEFEAVTSTEDVIQLAGQLGNFDLVNEYGVEQRLADSLDITTKMALAAALEALKDAGIPLVRTYRTTRTGTRLPTGWALPESMRDETGVVFASAFPGYNCLVDELNKSHRHTVSEALSDLESEIGAKAANKIRARLGISADEDHQFPRDFLFRVLGLGHAQIAEFIGARGPNIHVNAACASTTLALSTASDWIAQGRCKRVVIVGADDITNEQMLPFFGSGFLALGAATTKARVEDAALPFDRRRHGMIIGMGAVGLIVEEQRAAAARGNGGIAEILGVEIANSAYHGSRLDVDHITQVMEKLVGGCESRHGLDRRKLAEDLIFMSHETYTPARGGSAAAEVNALRGTFTDRTDDIVMTNVKGYTGHPMAVGLEDAIALRSLETGFVPAVPNFKEVDPDLGNLNLSKGGNLGRRYALRLAAGFGSQIAMALFKRVSDTTGRAGNDAVRAEWLRTATGIEDPVLVVENRALKAVARADVGDLPVYQAPALVQQDVAAAAPASAPAPVPAVTPAPVPAASPTPAPAAAPVSSFADEVQARLLALIAEKTGYPAEMLEPDLDLEADLGIDTVKQAEIFAMVREEYGIPRRDDLKLSDYPTIGAVVGFVLENTDEQVAPAAPAAAPAAPTAEASPPVAATPAAQTTPAGGLAMEVQSRLLHLIAEKTGYPAEMLEADLDLEADLGIDTVKQAEIFAMVRDAYGIPRRDDLKLSDYPTIGAVVGFVLENIGEESAAKLQATSAPVATATPVAVAAPSAAPATAPSPAPAGGFAAQVQNKLLNLIAEKTGYPVEMLEPDLDLEADLGIDTVKQAEIFAMVREAYGIPRRDDLKLSDYPTIGAVVGFVLENSAEAPAAQPVPAAPPQPEAAPASGFAAEVQSRLLKLISEKTGYPEEMLEPDLDLEADLGIDTVKQAEIFAMVREAYDIPRRDDLKLSDYPTIGAVVGFVLQNSDLVGTPEPIAEATPAPAAPPAPDVEPEAESAAEVEPVEELPLPAGGQARRFAEHGLRRLVPRIVTEPLVVADPITPTGVVALVGSRSKVLSSLWEQFKAGGFEVRQIRRTAKGGTPQVVEALSSIDNLQGVVVIAPTSLAFLPPEQAAFKEQLEANVTMLFHAARAVREPLLKMAGEGKSPFFTTVVRADGRFGHGEGGKSKAYSPVLGAVSGFTKALSREFTGVRTTVIDIDSGEGAENAAATVFGEVASGSWKAEIGYLGTERAYVAIGHEPLDEEGEALLALDGKSTVLLTGAGQGITAQVARDIATRTGSKIAILDIVPLPDDPKALKKRLAGDPAKVKKDLFAALKKEGGRVTPAVVERELGRLTASLTAAENLAWFKEQGITASYHLCDVTDPKAVAKAAKTIGTVDAVVHGAGLEESKSVEKKDPTMFERILFVKALGAYNLWTSCKDRGLKSFVMFGSIAGRMGNAGQTDYSAANDLFSWFARAARADSGGKVRGATICWAGWEGVGMATRGSIPEILKRAGVTMIPLAAGTGVVGEEISFGAAPEIVVAGSLGAMDRDGSVIPEATSLRRGLEGAALPLKLRSIAEDGLVTFEMALKPKGVKFLEDHAIDGTPVLPGVIGLESFATVGQAFYPGFSLSGFKDVVFTSPAKFHRGREVKFVCRAQKVPSGELGVVAVKTSLSSKFKARVKGAKEQDKLHFEAVVLFAGQRRQGLTGDPPPASAAIAAGPIYDVYFHGPAFQVLEAGGIEKKSAIGLRNRTITDSGYIAAPMLVELAFQTAGLWGIVSHSAMALPAGIGAVEFATNGTGQVPAAAVSTNIGEDLYDVTVVAEDGTEILSLKRFAMARVPGRKVVLETT